MKMTPIACVLSMAFTATISAQENANDTNADVEKIIVTGSSVARTEADTPAKTTLINKENIANTGFSSQADILMSVPGIKVEGGGGEVATNAFVRGLPSGGQFQFTPLNYDGMPAFQSGMTSSAQDVYYRPDIGIERVEYVGGGVSNLFGPGSVAGIINYISRKGSDDPESTIQLEIAEDGRIRTDFFNSGALSSDDNIYYALSGFYRYDEGPLDTGLPTKGYQIRGNIRKEFDDGFITFHGQMINDKVQFFLPLPLDGASRDRLIGNDGSTVFVGQTVAAAELSYPTANGQYESPIRDGVSTEGGSFGVDFAKELTDSWRIAGKAKAASYDHQFNLFLDGDGIANSPEPLDGYINNSARTINGDVLSALGTANFTWSETGSAVPEDYLLFGNRLLDRQRDGDFFSTEFNLTGELEGGGFDHTVNIGTFFIHAQQMDYNIISSYLADFSNGKNARLVDLSFTNASGETVMYSRNGVVGPGTSYTNKDLTSKRTAFYITDQMENESWAFDVGMRIERAVGTSKSEGSEVVVVSDDPSLAPNLQVNTTGNGKFTYGEVSTTEAAFSAALLYKMEDSDLNLYANASKGYFFPQIRSITFDPNGEPQSYEGEDITLGAIGFKYFPKDLYIDASLFIANLDNRRSVDFENDGSGGLIELVKTQSTETIGAEVIGRYNLSDEIVVEGNVTYQDAEFTEGNDTGKVPRRQPEFTGNLAVSYNNGFVDSRLALSYFGDAYANDDNSVELDSHTIATFNAGYTWELNNDQRIRVGVNVWNLFDNEGITEGSPRQGNSQVSGGEFFVGRPVLPRRISLTARYDF
ncbi:TonB-dependent receptor plug domain-containing protein [Aliiglaciecola sp. 2_MG-2023]|uniref:TonB-dependent receptor plug domain-containing protein n=1 Tax=unclassified Aliiglaciecola TaxID=2593648 RepID=UPI0026E2EB1C|nr:MULTISPECIES: TonB-dependent receptor plug domain-containing protein [unclassified Aliiglaciecola]MDO6713002.1 TonB-dependent receptor plug domain-containing protein [Aliiglaciecola sp. 2_MG-2023]MDO6754041.1 TonB-dependent receptor plug domain-containing protein [Aliiglaciecola sp. 1_MG-2023]